MRIKKTPCLAWVRRCTHTANQNRIVTVHPEFQISPEGRHMWLVTSNERMPGIDLATGKDLGNTYEGLWCDDNNLTPINDPGLDVGDVDTQAPKDVSKFDYDIKEKEALS